MYNYVYVKLCICIIMYMYTKICVFAECITQAHTYICIYNVPSDKHRDVDKETNMYNKYQKLLLGILMQKLQQQKLNETAVLHQYQHVSSTVVSVS